jgi:hypothetical protein
LAEAYAEAYAEDSARASGWSEPVLQPKTNKISTTDRSYNGRTDDSNLISVIPMKN